MKIAKTRNVKTPTRANWNDAGIDFYVPEFDEKFLEDLRNKNDGYISVFSDQNDNAVHLNLAKHERILIPSGIHVNFVEEAHALRISNTRLRLLDEKCDVGLALIAHNKSGVASKKGLDRLAEVVDESYQGEVHISLVNTSDQTIQIKPGDKIIQFILAPIFYSNVDEVKIEELYNEKTSRGTNGFGSTDSK